MIAILDYGMSNLKSVCHALHTLGADARIITSPAQLARAQGIVIPGDGAFGPAMQNLRTCGWLDPLASAVSRQLPLLGICLGMQLLFESSTENGEHQGLGYLRGRVVKFPSASGKIPQIGWNQLQVNPVSRFLTGIPDNTYAYFVHSYYCAPADPGIITAQTEYGIPYASVVESDNIWGAQFHPEKSGALGLAMLKNFINLTTDDRGDE